MRRVRTALDSVRPYLGSHGGDVHVARGRPTGWSGWSSRAAAGAVRPRRSPWSWPSRTQCGLPRRRSHRSKSLRPQRESGRRVISAESLLEPGARERPAVRRTGMRCPNRRAGAGEVGGFTVAGLAVLACRVGDDLFAYRDRCAGCAELAGRRGAAPAGRTPGGRRGAALPDLPGALRRCARRRRIDENAEATGISSRYPLLVARGVLSVAVPAEAPGRVSMIGAYACCPHPGQSPAPQPGRGALRDVLPSRSRTNISMW